jgi:hypothetical protein
MKGAFVLVTLIAAALDFTLKRYHKSVLPNVGSQNFVQAQMLRLLRDMIIGSALATLVCAAGPARAVDYFWVHFGHERNRRARASKEHWI